MLFLLTGDVQTGKTRWLESVLEDMASWGVGVYGVIAPGVWRKREPGEQEGTGTAGRGDYEKLGIDNVLLPSGERVPFARRRDLACAEGSFDPESQSAAARLGWEISDAAIERVNAHFDDIARGASLHEGVISHDGATSHEGATWYEGEISHDRATSHESTPASLLVVDEFGQLELLRGGGLTSAVVLVEAGATERCPHALVVVRDWLCERAEHRFADEWGGATVLVPGDGARAALRDAFGVGTA